MWGKHLDDQHAPCSDRDVAAWSENLGVAPNVETKAFAAGLTADEDNTNTCQEFDNSGYCIKGAQSRSRTRHCRSPSHRQTARLYRARQAGGWTLSSPCSWGHPATS